MKISLRRRHAQTVKNGASSHITNYIKIFSMILNLEGHLNSCIGSAILLNGWILPIGGIESGWVCLGAYAADLYSKNQPILLSRCNI